jgi:hypothetical protein
MKAIIKAVIIGVLISSYFVLSMLVFRELSRWISPSSGDLIAYGDLVAYFGWWILQASITVAYIRNRE